MARKCIDIEVKEATVKVLGKGGQGVLIDGGAILTAAHCIDFKCDASMVLGAIYIEKIKTSKGQLLKVAPLVVEPVSDIAILGSLDDQTFLEEAGEFQEFCMTTKPIRLCLRDFKRFRKFPIRIYTHKGTWVTGSAARYGEEGHVLWIEADKPIEGGTSGGPIIDESGELVAIVSNFSEVKNSQERPSGCAPRPHLTIPVWSCRKFLGMRLIR